MAAKHRYIKTEGYKPQANEIEQHESVINEADGTIWTKDSGGNVIQIGGSSGGVGGSGNEVNIAKPSGDSYKFGQPVRFNYTTAEATLEPTSKINTHIWRNGYTSDTVGGTTMPVIASDGRVYVFNANYQNYYFEINELSTDNTYQGFVSHHTNAIPNTMDNWNILEMGTDRWLVFAHNASSWYGVVVKYNPLDATFTVTEDATLATAYSNSARYSQFVKLSDDAFFMLVVTSTNQAVIRFWRITDTSMTLETTTPILYNYTSPNSDQFWQTFKLYSPTQSDGGGRIVKVSDSKYLIPVRYYSLTATHMYVLEVNPTTGVYVDLRTISSVTGNFNGTAYAYDEANSKIVAIERTGDVYWGTYDTSIDALAYENHITDALPYLGAPSQIVLYDDKICVVWGDDVRLFRIDYDNASIEYFSNPPFDFNGTSCAYSTLNGDFGFTKKQLAAELSTFRGMMYTHQPLEFTTIPVGYSLANVGESETVVPTLIDREFVKTQTPVTSGTVISTFGLNDYVAVEPNTLIKYGELHNLTKVSLTNDSIARTSSPIFGSGVLKNPQGGLSYKLTGSGVGRIYVPLENTGQSLSFFCSQANGEVFYFNESSASTQKEIVITKHDAQDMNITLFWNGNSKNYVYFEPEPDADMRLVASGKVGN